VSDDVTKLGKRIDELTAQIAQLTSAPVVADPDKVGALLRDLEETEAARRHALRAELKRRAPTPDNRTSMTSAAQATHVPVRSAIPLRERVLAGLELLGVPARGGLVSAAATARTGLTVELRQLASLRRSELASWRAAPDRRPAYVVPALHARRFEPLRGIVASSAWEPWRRILGPLSPRADHLRATIRVVENVAWAREHSPDLAARFERLLWRLARSVPGTLDETEFDIERVARAARAELALVDEEDRPEREAAAKRLSKLPAEQQLFGAGLQIVREENA
jgi:hypothetical protein